VLLTKSEQFEGAKGLNIGVLFIKSEAMPNSVRQAIKMQAF
jgi:hypothetical protein